MHYFQCPSKLKLSGGLEVKRAKQYFTDFIEKLSLTLRRMRGWIKIAGFVSTRRKNRYEADPLPR